MCAAVARIDEGPSEEGPSSLLPDSLTARASFTRGFPHYPYPNLPMTLRSVVNRCANSEQMIGLIPLKVNGLGLRILHISERIQGAFTLESGCLGLAEGHDLVDDHRVQWEV